jgi:hypothetical protein
MEHRNPPVEKTYDFFISYKSENIEIVRPIAEQLLANELRVWFSEYSLSIDTYLDTDAVLERAMLAGASTARMGICFTNNQYFSSKWCLMELAGLLECLAPESIIQVALPVRRTFSPPPTSLEKDEIEKIRQIKDKLKLSPFIEYKSIMNTLYSIRDISKLEFDVPLCEFENEASSNRTHFYFNDRDFSLDLSGWHLNQGLRPFAGRGNAAGPTFERNFDGTLVSGKVLMGAQDRDVSRASTALGYKSDRDYYKEAAQFAKTFVARELKRQLSGDKHHSMRGLHLLFLLGHSQLAFTTLSVGSASILYGGAGTYTRTYSIVVPESNHQPDTEIAISFSYPGLFPDFCRCAPQMDRLVLSLEKGIASQQTSLPSYGKNLSSWRKHPALWIATILLFLFAGFVPGMNNPWLGDTITEAGILALLATQIVGSLATLSALRVRGITRSALLVIVMIVCGFWSALISMQLVDNLLKRLDLNPQQMSFVFGVLMLFMGNLAAFVTLGWPQWLRNTKTSRRK